MRTPLNRFKHLPHWSWKIENKGKFRGSRYWHNSAAQLLKRAPCAQTAHNSGDKFVVCGGSGFYYDRGELFSYLSPGYAAGEVEGGPFGIVQAPPFVTQQHCSYSSSYNAANPTYLHLYYVPICGGGYGDGGNAYVDNSQYNLATPWGTTLGPGPLNPKASDIANYLPNAAAIIDGTVGTNSSGQPYSMIGYSGAVGSIYYSTFNGITNPIVPLAPGSTKENALTGQNGAF